MKNNNIFFFFRMNLTDKLISNFLLMRKSVYQELNFDELMINNVKCFQTL
jgi:hypothetical protein